MIQKSALRITFQNAFRFWCLVLCESVWITAVQAVGAEEGAPLQFVFKDEFQRASTETDQWRRVRGQWHVSGVSQADFSTNAFCCRAEGEDALAVVGYPVWKDYRVSVAFRCLHPDRDGAGIYFYGDDNGTGYIFRYLNGQLALINHDAHGAQELCRQPLTVLPEQWYELSVRVRGTTVLCFLDSSDVFRCSLGDRTRGVAGMWARSSEKTVIFDDFELKSIDDLVSEPFPNRHGRINTHAEHDKYMKKWAQLGAGAEPGLLDYTFHRAPVDWFVHSGKWGIQSRWECQPRWTWFGGYGDASAAIWHKASFEGDVAVDLYVAFRMDHPFDPDYSHPGDINVSLCADGSDLTSGYTMVLAGWRNRRSCLYRRHEIVAEHPGPLLPDNRNTFPYRELHIPWYHVRMERSGNTLHCSFDGKEVLSFEDPAPLSGKRLAVWTWNNPLLIARAQVQADRISAVLPLEAAEPAVSTNEGKTLGPFVSGREFRCVLSTGGIQLQKTPRLRFEYGASPGLLANLYVEAEGRVHQIHFSAPNVRADAIPVAGEISSPVLDGGWHVAEVDLLAPLASAYRKKQFVLGNVWVGLEADDPYILAGYGGNQPGAVCHIRKMEWLPARADTPVSTSPRPVPVEPSRGELVNIDFSTGVGSCRPEGGIDGATLLWDPWHGSGNTGCLEIVNDRIGGCFATVLVDEPFSARRWPVLSFDYRITDGLRVDMFVETFSVSRGVRTWTVKFCDYDDTFPVIGSFREVTADGQWHHASVDLHHSLNSVGAGDDEIISVRLSSGGYPGNEAGTRFRIDNLRVSGAPASEVQEKSSAPQIVFMCPEQGSCSGDGLIQFSVHGPDSGVDWASLRLTINGVIRHVGDPGMTVNRETGLVEWRGDADSAISLLLKDGGALRCEVSVADFSGHSASTVSESLFVRFLDTRSPGAPYISFTSGKQLLRHTFENPDHIWGDWGGCNVQITDEVAATGGHSLELTKFDKGNTFQALGDIREIPLDAYPFICFDVMTPEHPRDGARHPYAYDVSKLFFDGKQDRQGVIGVLPELVPGQWTRVEFDMRKTNTEEAHDPYGILLQSGRDDDKPPGLQLYIDNFCIHSNDPETVSFEWSIPGDVSGITGYAWALDRSPKTVPQERILGAEPTVSMFLQEPGGWWFHVRAVDGAGNWGDTGHYGPMMCGVRAMNEADSR